MRTALVIKKVTDNATIKKSDGGTYTGLLIEAFKDGREFTRGIHPNGFRDYPGLKEKLLALNENDEVTLIQDDTGFKNVTDVVYGTETADPVKPFKKGFSGGKGKGTSYTPQDTARIARSTAVQAAAQLGSATSVVELLQQADAISAFILDPLGFDSAGNTKVSTTTKPQASSDDTPF